MPERLASALSSLKPEDFHVDSLGRLVVHNVEAAQRIAAIAPNLKRVGSAAASNNCSCETPQFQKNVRE